VGAGPLPRSALRDETPDERLDRELEELLQELRLALPGVQILFAFLLIVPFNNRFVEIDSLQRAVWFAALLLALGAVACLIAPTAYHRIRFRDFDKERLVMTATKLAIAGLAFLATSLAASAFFVTGFVFNDAVAALVAAVAVGTIGGLWFGVPLLREMRR
jgi:energy-converting hydrogenase Eha subunit H